MHQEIALYSEFHSPEQLQKLLHNEISDAVFLELRSTYGVRGIDPTILVAVATGGSHALVALVTGLLKLLDSKLSQPAKIIIRGSDGSTLEFPSTTTAQQVDDLVAICKGLNTPRIDIIPK